VAGISYVDQHHYGEMGSSNALVVLVYNVQDMSYYDSAETTYTGRLIGSGLPDVDRDELIVIDAYDWANRVCLSGRRSTIPRRPFVS
jgi:hypothetical protein